MLEEQRYILAGALFAVLLNMKHLFAYLGPVYFVFLLKHYVLIGGSSSSGSNASSSNGNGSSSSSGSSSSWAAVVQRLVLLGGTVVLICGASFGPFIAMGQMGQVRNLGMVVVVAIFQSITLKMSIT
jgi:alpha-1,3-glucosyltransferase